MRMYGDRGRDPFEVPDQWEQVCDPYPDLAQRRARWAVEPGGEDPQGTRAVMVLRHEEAAAVLRDAARFSSSAYAALMGPLIGHSILEKDDPEHRVQRFLVSPAFRQGRLSALTPMMRAILDELVDAFVGDGEADLVPALTLPFPVHVIVRLLGLPLEDADQFARWSLAIIGAPANLDTAVVASSELTEYLAPLVARRRAHPSDDVISDLCVAEVDGERLADDDIFAFVGLLLPAGFETTYRASGNLLFALLTHPDQLAAVRADASVVQPAIEETLRWETPVVSIVRTAREDVALGGVEIEAGTTVGVSLGSANRDERRYERAEEFDVFRTPLPHLSFGSGPHACLGMHLARIEMRAVLETVLERLPDVHLHPDAEGAHIHGEVFRSPTALPVRFGVTRA